jgi:hypothetical protein
MRLTVIRKIFIVACVLPPLFMVSGCKNSAIDENNIITSDEEGSTSINLQNLESALESIAPGEVNQSEIDGLLFMREEEKLAHDVYTMLYELWSERAFDNISNSEKTHTDAILLLLNRYNLEDPAEGNEIGVFTNTKLQDLYNTLVASGSASLIDALMVGAAIEEIDLIDIQNYLTQVEDNDDIVSVYENLMKGSRNHLRSFVKKLDNQGITYSPQYLEQSVYDAIINSPIERG